MVSPRRRFGSERIVILVGISALALAPLCADAALSYWPIRKRIRRPYATDRVEVYTEAATNKKWVFESDEATEIIADSAVVKNELDAGGHSSGGISARIKEVEDDLEALRIAYNAISFDTLNSASDDCDTKLTDFTNRVAALETAVASPAIIPVQCDAAGVAGLRRELNNGVLEWTCPCVFNYTSSADDTCDIASCPLPSTLTNDAHVVQNCAKTHLTAGTVCEFSCEDGYQPTGLASDTAGQITCGAAGGTPISTATSCTACTNSFTGVNCMLESCDLTANGFNGDANTVDTGTNDCPAQYMTAGSSCNYDCATGYMPSGETAVDTTGTITCAADGGATTPASPTCVTCDAAGFLGYTGVNCKLASCDISGFQNDQNAVANANDPCPSSVSYMAAGTDCNYDCATGYMPSGETAVDTTGTITCHANAGTTTPTAPTCVTCDAAGFLGYTGVNCELESCDLTANGFNGDANTIAPTSNACPAQYMTAGSSCNYDCASGYMPSGETAVDTTGTITCAADGGATTPASPTCVACSTKTGLEYHTGENCKLAPCDLTVNGFNGDANTIAPSSNACPAQYLIAGSSCNYDCADGYMPSGETTVDTTGTISCPTDGTTATTPAAPRCVTCADAGKAGYTGPNCKFERCDLDALTFTDDANFNNVDCLTTSYMEADDTCTFNCAAGYMPVGGTRGSPGNLTCSSDGGNTLDDANNTLTGSVTLCTACTSQYSGQNCGLNSCDISTLKNDNNFANINCPEDAYMAAGGSCTYDCADGFMPISATQTGQSGTISCAITGAVPGNDGITPSGTAACQSCADFKVPGNTGVNCATAPTQGVGGPS